MQTADGSFCETDCFSWKLQRMIVMASLYSYRRWKVVPGNYVQENIEMKGKYYAISDCGKYDSCITQTKEKKYSIISRGGKMPMMLISFICGFR